MFVTFPLFLSRALFANHSSRLLRGVPVELPELHRLSIGPDLVFGRLWAETGWRDVLNSLLTERRFSFDAERAVYLTVLRRLMISGPDRYAGDWCGRVRVPGAEGIDLDHACEAMAWLGAVDAAARIAHSGRDEFERGDGAQMPRQQRGGLARGALQPSRGMQAKQVVQRRSRRERMRGSDIPRYA